MPLLLIPFVFILGAAIGSFINVLAERTAREESISGRSYCENCNKKLKPRDLIPILSFLLTKGHCRYCKTKLSKQYILVEIVTALLYTLIFILVTQNHYSYSDYLNNRAHILDFGPIVPLLFYWIISIPLVALFITDFKYGMLYDKITIPTIIGILIYKVSVILYYITKQYLQFNQSELGKHFIEAGMVTNSAKYATDTFLQTIAGSIGIGLFFLILIIATKGRGMGGGDLKLGFLIGLLTGWPNMTVAIFLGFLTGALFSIILLLAQRKGLRQTIPFGPFLILACFIIMFFGNQLFGWYTEGILGYMPVR